MSYVDNATEIIPRLWLGNLESSQDLKFITQHGINVIINCTKDLPFIQAPGIYKYRVPVHDNLQMNEIKSMTRWLNHIVPLIDYHYRQGRTILIHCFAGMQRSAIVMLSYLYQHHYQSVPKSYNRIKQRRPIAFSPMMNFKLSFCNHYKLNPKLYNY